MNIAINPNGYCILEYPNSSQGWRASVWDNLEVVLVGNYVPDRVYGAASFSQGIQWAKDWITTQRLPPPQFRKY